MSSKYHFIGIGGIGMSGLAHILLEKNCTVSGSDLVCGYTIEKLRNCGAAVYTNHSAKYVSPDVTVVYSSDIKTDNEEYKEAKRLKCSLLHRSELLAKLMAPCLSLTVAGTHGKTTTASLLSWLLHLSNKDPSFAIGGQLANLNFTHAKYGKGEFFVAEACESDGSLLNYHPFGSIITNIDLDHMDFYQTVDQLRDTFRQFMSQVLSPKHTFWCGDDRHLYDLKMPGISYGFQSHCQLRAINYRVLGQKAFMDIGFGQNSYKDVELSLMGRHNALNSLAVFGLGLALGIEEETVRSALRTFSGVLRRLEKKGDFKTIAFYDDYAHHPTEIAATLQALRSYIKDKRLVVIYQPHRYSRAKNCIGSYGKCFSEAEALFVTDIFAANEKIDPHITSEMVFADIKKNQLIPTEFVLRAHLSERIHSYIRPHDVVISLGAGDIYKFYNEITPLLETKGVIKISVGVVTGGMSPEHDIALLSAANLKQSHNEEIYDIHNFYINPEGYWQPQNEQTNGLISSEVLHALQNCDILFPVLHGPNGEDGTIQGFFEILNKPYVGCSFRASAIAMDKVLTKRLAKERGLAVAPDKVIDLFEWKEKKLMLLESAIQLLSFPMYVKPVHLGSSIAVTKVLTCSELEAAIEEAFRYDMQVLVEKEMVGRELEFAIIGNDNPTVFPPGEIRKDIQPYDFRGKYSQNGTPTIPQAILDEETKQMGMDFALQCYLAIGCAGMARVDLFLDESNQYWLNEINPIPGCTNLSLFPRICEANGLSKQELIDALIILGLRRKRLEECREAVKKLEFGSF